MHLEIGARTDVGRLRENNEDSFAVEPKLNVFVVSDGMGGAEHGEVASGTAVTAILDHCRNASADPALPLEGESRPDLSDKTNRLVSAIQCAHVAIARLAAADASLRGMGATVVAAWVDGDRMSLAHVGDSRAYRLRSGVFEQLTRDHSLIAEQLRLGLLTSEQASESKLQTILTRALGHTDHLEVDAEDHELAEGDAFLLCSDGLSRMVPDSVIAQAIEQTEPAQAAADRLIELANEAGGEDNITAVVFRAGRGRGFLRRMQFW